MRGQRLILCFLMLLFTANISAAQGVLTPAQGDSLRRAAEAHIRDERPEDAAAALQTVIDAGYEQAEVYVLLGHACLSRGDGRGAKKAFEKAIKLGAKAAGRNGIGLVYLKDRDKRRARVNFRRALGEDPTFVEAQYNLAVTYQDSRPSEALKAFEQVLELDARHRDAYYRIGLLLEEQEDSIDAIAAYRQQVAAYPAHSRAGYRLAKLLLGKGQKREAVQIFEEMIAAGGEVEPRIHLEMALISQADRDFEHAQQFFETYIDQLPGEEQRLYRDISFVATKEELTHYENTPDDQKEEVNRRFWKRRDPAPLSASNERLVEHYRRVAHARQHFAQAAFPWDDRGGVYIRLGHPDHVSRSSDIQAELDPYIQDARTNFINRFRIGLRVHPGLPMFPVRTDVRWEYWVYADIDGGTEITFVSEHGNRRYVFAPVPRGSSMSLTTELMKLHGRVIVDQIAVKQASIYAPDFADLPIDFHYYPASYRGPEDKTRLEIYYGLPASEVVRLNVDEKTDLLVLGRGLAIFDSLWNEVHRVQDQIVFQVPTDQQIEKGAFIPGILPVDLPPGPYHMAFQVQDFSSGKSQVYQQEILLEDYRGREALQISDIELAFSMAPVEEGPFVKQGLEIIPMSSRAFRDDQNAFVYFEIYNLRRDEFGQTQYRVEYKLRSYEERSVPARVLHGFGRLFRISEQGQEVVIAYEQTGEKQDEVAYVELDLTRTRPGGQKVQVAVIDLLANKKVSKEIRFEIIP